MPDAHALIGTTAGHPLTASHAPAALRIRSLERDTADTQLRRAVRQRGIGGRCGTRHADTGAVRLAARAQRAAPQRNVRPVQPPTITSVKQIAGSPPAPPSSSAGPRANRRSDRPPNPALTARASALFAGGARSNISNPGCAVSPHQAATAKQLNQPIREADHAPPIAARHSAKRRSSSGAPTSAIGVCNHLGKHGRISQPKVEPLPRDRMQRLRGVPDQHGARRGRVPAARVSFSGYEARRPTRTNRPARHPNRACNSRR